jgi:hypothetical protein
MAVTPDPTDQSAAQLTPPSEAPLRGSRTYANSASDFLEDACLGKAGGAGDPGVKRVSFTLVKT